MYILKEIGNRPNISYNEYTCDSVDDIININNPNFGDECYIIEAQSLYVKSSENKWKLINGIPGAAEEIEIQNSSDKLQDIYWDGNTDGRDVLFDSRFKVSDKAFTKEEVIGATLVLTYMDKPEEEILLTSDNVHQVTDGLILVSGQMDDDSGIMFVSTSISGEVMGEEIPSKGTYFAKDSQGYYYISSLIFP